MDPLIVETIHLFPKENSEKHRTNRYEVLHEDIPVVSIVRRGQSFSGLIHFRNRPHDPEADVVHFIFSLGDNPYPKLNTQGSVFMRSNAQVDQKSWSVQITEDRGDVVTFDVMTPADTPIGCWVLQVVTSVKGGYMKNTFSFNDFIYILFNPWNSADLTFMEEQELLDEYVLTDVGKIWAGTTKTSKGRMWMFGQFDAVVLPTCLFMLDRANIPFHERGDPVKLSRAISRIVNCNDEDGVLYGSWDGIYAGGTAPALWTGSVEILKQFYETQTAVRYGQCWVFAGVVTTVSRALGLPSRVVTNFESAHDSNQSLTLDKFYSESMEEVTTEMIWNFHVWNDVWMARPDLPPGYGGWQTIDATPQELSSGVYQCGPAPVEAVKQGVIGLGHDVSFVLASVNADLMRWKRNPNVEGGYVKIETDKYFIGQKILTKKPFAFDPIGDEDCEDITHIYKYQEGTNAERLALYYAVRQFGPTAQRHYAMTDNSISDVKFNLVDTNVVKIGEDFVIVVRMHNLSKMYRSVKAVVRITSYFYNGVKAKVIKETDGEITIAPGGFEEAVLLIDASEYMDKLVEGCHVKVSAICSVQETSQTWADDSTFQIIKPSIVIKFNEDLILRKSTMVALSFTNPLEVPLTNCEFRLAGHGMQTLKQQLHRVGAKEMASVDVSVVFMKPGNVSLIATFDSMQLKDISGTTSAQVYEE